MKKLTIAEYAELNNISVQAVYKKIKKLQTVKEERNGKTITLILMEEDADKPAEGGADIKPSTTDYQPNTTEFQPQNQPNSTDFKFNHQPTFNQDIQPNSTENKGEEVSPALFQMLKEQLEEKDRQIERLQKAAEEKDKQLQEQFDRLSSLLLRSQELEALTHKLLLGQGENAPSEEAPPQEQKRTVEEQPPKKKKWYSFLFQ